MGKHINLFETKTKEELLELYKEYQRLLDEVYVGNIIDIGETYITVEIDYKTGEELDVFFSELKDVRLIK